MKHDSHSDNWDGDDDDVQIVTGKGKHKAWSKEKNIRIITLFLLQYNSLERKHSVNYP